MRKLYFSGLFLSIALASTAQTVVMNETFEGGTIPAGWTQLTTATDGGWKVGANTDLQSDYFPIPGHTMFIATNDDACNCDKSNDLLISPIVDLTALTSPYLSFDNFFFGATYQGATEIAQVLASTDAGTNWTLLKTLDMSTTGDWDMQQVDLSAYAGNSAVLIAFKYNDGGGWLYGWGLDNVKIFEPAATAASLVAVIPNPGSPQSYVITASTASISGTIRNEGSAPITDITVKYSDGANTYTDMLTGLNIPAFETYDFTHSTPYTVSAGPNEVNVWVELTGDADQTNDTVPTVLVGVPFMPATRVVVEEGTGTWCGWCPRGTVYMDSLHAEHPATSVCIAVHNGDPMTNTTYDAAVSGIIPGYPSVLFNRSTVTDPSNILVLHNERKNDFSFADLAMNVTYTAATRKLTVVTDAHFATSLSGDYRIAMVVTEDHVTGTAAGYNQTNYYSGGGNGPMNGWETLPNPVPAADMEYNFVARALVGGFNGQTGSLPATITEGSTYQYTSNYTIPVVYNPYNMNAIILLIDKNNSSILNGNIVPLNTIVSGVASQVPAQLLTLSPNPGTVLNASLMLNNTADISIKMTNVLGQTVLAEQHMDVPAGANSFQIDGTQMNDGIYVVDITADNVSVYSGKVMIVH